MNKKIIAIAIVSMFLLTGFSLVSAETIKESEDYTKAKTSNTRPSAPLIEGPRIGKVGQEYYYWFRSSDADGDELYYNVTMGDGTSYTLGPAESGHPVGVYHTYDLANSYIITAQAHDGTDGSDRSTLSVNIPRSQSKNNIEGDDVIESLFSLNIPYLNITGKGRITEPNNYILHCEIYEKVDLYLGSMFTIYRYYNKFLPKVTGSFLTKKPFWIDLRFFKGSYTEDPETDEIWIEGSALLAVGFEL